MDKVELRGRLRSLRSLQSLALKFHFRAECHRSEETFYTFQTLFKNLIQVLVSVEWSLPQRVARSSLRSGQR